MRKLGLLSMACTAILSLISMSSNAALIGRLPATQGGTDYQAYYDNVLDITWLADANLAASNTFGLPYSTDLGMHPNDTASSSYPTVVISDGRLGWGAALHWIDAMNSSKYLGFGDWRLPAIMDISNNGCDWSYSGTDCGWNMLTGSAATTIYSELASLWYDTLGNLAYYDPSGNVAQPGWGLTNTGPFTNIKSYYYWTGLEFVLDSNNAWIFHSPSGNQFASTGSSKSSYFYGWAVRTGDVSAVPIPPTLWLFGSGLLGLVGVARRKKAA